MEELYYVHEENEKGEWVAEYFDTRKEDAIRYFKQRVAICDGQYRGWEKEKRENECRWSKVEKWTSVKLEKMEWGELKRVVNFDVL